MEEESTLKKQNQGVQLFRLVSILMSANFMYLLSKYTC